MPAAAEARIPTRWSVLARWLRPTGHTLRVVVPKLVLPAIVRHPQIKRIAIDNLNHIPHKVSAMGKLLGQGLRKKCAFLEQVALPGQLTPIASA